MRKSELVRVNLPHEPICTCQICAPDDPLEPIYVKKFTDNEGRVLEATGIFKEGRLWKVAFIIDGKRRNMWNMWIRTWNQFSMATLELEDETEDEGGDLF